MKKFFLLSVFSFMVISCRQEADTVGPSGPTIYLQTKNLKSLNLGEGHYEAWISFIDPAQQKISSPTDEDSSFVSIGKFNVNGEGSMLGLDGSPFTPQLSKVRNPQYMVDAIITIESENDTEDLPGSVVIGGAFTGNLRIGTAHLTTDYRDAFTTDFRNAQGYFLLDAPTSDDPSDSLNGIWFMKSVSPDSLGLLNLPYLPEEWKYESWIQCQFGPPMLDTLSPCSLGKFVLADSADEDGAGVWKGSRGNGHQYPGQDFVTSPPELKLLYVFITIEPEPDNSPKPFHSLKLFGPTDIPTQAPRGKPFQLLNNSEKFPTAKITVVK
ncbi:MAG TPA: hypothetical protein VFF29_07090 [Bacteroidota bacterium]|nr:hypothetical protein [Bacteroidota bacterium]